MFCTWDTVVLIDPLTMQTLLLKLLFDTKPTPDWKEWV
jgi:hypothetical protein